MPRGREGNRKISERERRLREMTMEIVKDPGFEDEMPFPYEEAMSPAFHGLFPWHCKNCPRGNRGVRKE